MDHVCKVISKSRRLTPETAKLFYSAERTELTMYDVTSELNKYAAQLTQTSTTAPSSRWACSTPTSRASTSSTAGR
jgi:hypothetical protein